MTGAPLICNHVHVDSIRTDPLPATPGKPRETVVDGGSLTDRCDSIAAQTRRQLSQAGIHQNRIMLPEIDTHSLGQLIQMILLATAIEASTVDWGLNQADGIR